MTNSGAHKVSIRIAAPRTIAAVHGRLTVMEIPAKCISYLDQVYAAAKTGAIALDGQNIFVYHPVPGRPDDVDAAFGVGVAGPFEPIGNVRPTAMPIGEAAMTTNWGSYAGLRAAHNAVITWCRENGRKRTGIRWEVYGHWTDDESRLQTDVYHLLEPA
jgi:hypothetical protein